MTIMLFRVALAVLLLSGTACEGRQETDKGVKKKSERAADGIKWRRSLDEGLEEARKKEKLVMLDFHSDRCGWCRILESKTYTDADVISRAKDFVTVKLDAQKDYAVAGKYRVTGLPTILFLDSKGKVVHRVIGFRGPADLLDEMKKAGGGGR